MNEQEMIAFLKEYDGHLYINKDGVISRMDGITPNGVYAYMEFVEDPVADAEHPSRVGMHGMLTVRCIREGRIWKKINETKGETK